jgi:hypothetical protein
MVVALNTKLLWLWIGGGQIQGIGEDWKIARRRLRPVAQQERTSLLPCLIIDQMAGII